MQDLLSMGRGWVKETQATSPVVAVAAIVARVTIQGQGSKSHQLSDFVSCDCVSGLLQYLLWLIIGEEKIRSVDECENI